MNASSGQCTDPHTCCSCCSTSGKHLHLHFLRSPVAIRGETRSGEANYELQLEKNILKPTAAGTDQKAFGSGEVESLKTQMVLIGIGYKSQATKGVAYDAGKGIIPNQ